MSEKDLYPRVAKWAKRRFRCHHVAIDRGLQAARIDVVGLRDVGGRLSGDYELIAIEVKAGNQPFAASAGQARGYGAYADRCYLADYRQDKGPFSQDELDVATSLGIGLIRITDRRIEEVTTSPRLEPVPRLWQELLDRLGYAECTICRSPFDFGERGYRREYLSRSSSRGGVLKAATKGLGYVYWLDDISQRNHKVDSDSGFVDGKGNIYARRYMCLDCVRNLFDEMVE